MSRFPQYRYRDFYISGESYAGKCVILGIHAFRSSFPGRCSGYHSTIRKIYNTCHTLAPWHELSPLSSDKYLHSVLTHYILYFRPLRPPAGKEDRRVQQGFTTPLHQPQGNPCEHHTPELLQHFTGGLIGESNLKFLSVS